MGTQVESERGVVSKVTSKLQVTIPKAIADRFGIEAGGRIVWEVVGRGLRVTVPGRERRLGAEERGRLMSESWARQRARDAIGPAFAPVEERDWTREDLYEDRGGRPR